MKYCVEQTKSHVRAVKSTLKVLYKNGGPFTQRQVSLTKTGVDECMLFLNDLS